MLWMSETVQWVWRGRNYKVCWEKNSWHMKLCSDQIFLDKQEAFIYMIIWGGGDLILFVHNLITTIYVYDYSQLSENWVQDTQFNQFLNHFWFHFSLQIKGKLSLGITGRINWLSSLISVPYSDLNITTTSLHTYAHIHTTAQRGKVSKTHRCGEPHIFIYILIIIPPQMDGPTQWVRLLHNKSLFFIWKTCIGQGKSLKLPYECMFMHLK